MAIISALHCDMFLQEGVSVQNHAKNTLTNFSFRLLYSNTQLLETE